MSSPGPGPWLPAGPAPGSPVPPAYQPHRPRVSRASGVIFAVLVGLAVLLGSLVMALVLLTSNAPVGTVLGAFLAALPVGPLLLCYLWLDRYEPEPRTLLVLGLGWGAFVATSSALIAQQIGAAVTGGDTLFSATVLAPVTEELAKGLFILLLLWFRRNDLDGVLDGIVYAGMVGIGFAYVENIIYLGHAYVGDESGGGGVTDALQLFILRCVFGPFAHPLFTAFTGIGIGIAVSTRRRALRVWAPIVGYALAVVAHGTWNAAASTGNFLATYVLVMVPAFVLVAAFALWARSREPRILTAALEDCARRGFLSPVEIPWLVKLPARQVCRTNARRVGGERALRTMKDYQRQALELGYLHHRFLRGTAPKDFVALGQEHVEAMRRLRPGLVWPQGSRR